MARNKISDLRDHLFAQLERLNDEDLTEAKMQLEVQRSKAITAVSSELIESAKMEINFLEATGQLKGSGFFDPINPGQKVIEGRDTND
jgi:hypothetical protein